MSHCLHIASITMKAEGMADKGVSKCKNISREVLVPEYYWLHDIRTKIFV